MAMTHVSHATMSSKPVKPTASAKSMKTTAPTKAVPAPAAKPMPTPAATTAPSGECRDVRHHAERANRDARYQNSYCFLPHGAFPNRTSKSPLVLATLASRLT
jgi:hypothetical protein